MVGKMPFSGKHGIKTFYTDGCRAAVRGDEKGKLRQEDNIRGYIGFNNIRMLAGLLMTSVGAVNVFLNDQPQFIPEMAMGVAMTVGYAASVQAERMILGRLQSRPISSFQRALAAPTPIPAPSFAERVVADIAPRVAIGAMALHLVAYAGVELYQRTMTT